MNSQHAPPEVVAVKAIAAHYLPYAAVVLAVVVFWQLDFDLGRFAFFLPILVAAGLWLIAQGLKDKADHRAIESMHQRKESEAGRWTAVCGKAVALEANAERAFDNVLAFRYQVFEEEMGSRSTDGSRSKHIKIRYDGFYLVPTGVETAAGVVKLCGFPDLIHLEKRSLPNGVHARAEEKAQLNPRFLPPFLARILMLAHTRDRIDVYIKYEDKEEANEGTCKSWVLRPDEQICVFGLWSNGELLPSSNRLRGLPVYAGTAEEVLERLKDDSYAFFIVGASLIAAATVWVLWSSF